MTQTRPRFRHQTIDPDPPGSHHDITLVADLTSNGLADIVIGGKCGEVNLFWYENPTWARHEIAHASDLEAGGVMADITDNGTLDIVAGQQHNGNELYWFECPDDPRQPWPKRVIEDRFRKYHDQAVGDVDGDGEVEIVVLSQGSGVLVYYDIPADPRVSPWPQECCHVIAEGVGDMEGLVVVDLDDDGHAEVIAGTTVYRPDKDPHGPWSGEPFASGFVKTRVAVADLNDDGVLDLVVCEGESHPGRLVWLEGPEWKQHLLRDDLFHPHSLAIADFTGNGRPDIFVAEMGLGRNPEPKMIIYLNAGAGEFEEFVFERGVPTHEAKVADLTGNGMPDIVGKPYEPERHIDAWLNET